MIAEIDSKIVKRLREWEEKDGPLSRPLEFYRRLLDIQSRAQSQVSVLTPDTNKVAVDSRIEQRLPLLAFDDLAIDWSLLQNTFDEVMALFAGYSEVANQVPGNMKDLGCSLARLKKVTRDWFERRPLTSEMATSSGNEAALELVIRTALRPFLIAHREALLGLVNQEQWRCGYCPICGGSPDFAFLDKERGARWLLCSRCDAEWLFRRLECPYCATQDQDALAYFTDDRGLYRLYVCERCRRYLKAIDLRHADCEVLLPLERFLTLDIDIQAQRDGYTP